MMEMITAVSSTQNNTNDRQQHSRPELNCLINKAVGESKIFQYIYEEYIKRGGLTNEC